MRRKRNSNKSKYIWISVSVAIVLIASAAVYMFILKEKDISVPTKATPPVEEVVSNEPTTDNKTNESIDEEKEDESSEPVKEKPQVSKSGYIEGQELPSEPTYINGVLIVNKQYPLPQDYNKGVDPEAAAALTDMIAGAKAAGFEVEGFSGFRSYEYQTSLYERYVSRDGQEEADRYSARPGYSEHQSGLSFDIGEVGKQDLWLTEEFGETPAGKWLMEHAHEYGFILRYPKGTEEITGYMYESWHYRYVGKKVATEIYEKSITLEEYLNID